jgi:hypothetical protein
MVINKSEQQFHHNVAMTNFGFIPVTNYVPTNEAIFLNNSKTNQEQQNLGIAVS